MSNIWLEARCSQGMEAKKKVCLRPEPSSGEEGGLQDRRKRAKSGLAAPRMLA